MVAAVSEAGAFGMLALGFVRDLDEIPAWTPPGPRVLLHIHNSAPLSEILVSLNKRSQNLYAEQVVRTAAVHRGGDGSMASARRTVLEVLPDLGVHSIVSRPSNPPSQTYFPSNPTPFESTPCISHVVN